MRMHFFACSRKIQRPVKGSDLLLPGDTIHDFVVAKLRLVMIAVKIGQCVIGVRLRFMLRKETVNDF